MSNGAIVYITDKNNESLEKISKHKLHEKQLFLDKVNSENFKEVENYFNKIKHKVDADTYIEEFVPRVLRERSTIVVVDKKGDTVGYITEKELAISLSKTSYNESQKTS